MRERLGHSLRVTTLMLIAGLALSGPVQAASEPPSSSASSFSEPSPYAIAFDVMILRPLGFVSTVVGLAFFVPAALVSIPYGPEGREEAWNQLVDVPIERTFRRPLGDF